MWQLQQYGALFCLSGKEESVPLLHPYCQVGREVLRRLFDLGALDQQSFWDSYRAELERLRKLTRDGTGGGDFYNSLGARVSKRFARALVASTLEGQTLFRDAFHMLGVRKSATFYREAEKLGLR